MLVKVLKKEKWFGRELRPGICELPEADAVALADRGVVRVIEPSKMTNLAPPVVPAGGFLLVKNPPSP